MKYVFFDKSKSVYIKVFPNPESLEKEVFGIKCFANYVEVPKVKVLDSRVAAISELNGFLGYQILEEELNAFIVNFFLKMEPIKITQKNKKFSILAEIERMKVFFQLDKVKVAFLNQLSKDLRNTKLYPVHGDIQKLNIIVFEGKIGLIDFEHFILAPKELEVVNSLFFADGNCLDLLSLTKNLPNGFFNIKYLRLMLFFYMLKQVYLGMEEEKALLYLKEALLRLKVIDKSKGHAEEWMIKFTTDCG